MSLEIENINPLAHAQWDRLILESNRYSFFHSYAWIRVLWESYGYKPNFFILKNQRGLHSLFLLMEVNSRYTERRGGTKALKLRSYEVMKLEDSKVGIIHFI